MTLADLMGMMGSNAGGAVGQPRRQVVGQGFGPSAGIGGMVARGIGGAPTGGGLGSLGALLGGGAMGGLGQRAGAPGQGSPTGTGSYSIDPFSLQVRQRSRVVGQNFSNQDNMNRFTHGTAAPWMQPQAPQRQLSPVQYPQFNVGGWGGMQNAVNNQRRLDANAGAYGATLSSLLGPGGGH